MNDDSREGIAAGRVRCTDRLDVGTWRPRPTGLRHDLAHQAGTAPGQRPASAIRPTRLAGWIGSALWLATLHRDSFHPSNRKAAETAAEESDGNGDGPEEHDP
jgi:hypothetical protein